MFEFTYWLETFKEMQPAKAQSVVKVLRNLSYKTETICRAYGKLDDSKTLVSFRRIKQTILKCSELVLNQNEKKALSLFDEFLEFCEYSHFVFPELQKSKLLPYCQTMQMSYSYKAVLIIAMVGLIQNGVTTTIDSVVQEMIKFYSDRIGNGLCAEKKNSIFSNQNPNFEEAKRIVICNPLKVLVEAGVLLFDKRSVIVSFTNDYHTGDEQYKNMVIESCIDRLETYYTANNLSTQTTIYSDREFKEKSVKEVLSDFENVIDSVRDIEIKKKLGDIYRDLIAVITGSENISLENKRPLITPISCEDDRKIGALVKDCMGKLEEQGYNFNEEAIIDFLSLDWSKKTLKLYYPFFKLFDETKSVSEQRVDHLGNGRYWNQVYTFNNKRFLITSEWYKESKPFFVEWFNSL